MFDYLRQHHYRLVVGSSHAFDAQIEDCKVTSFVLKHGLTNGDIVIVHDRSYTLPEVEELLLYCQRENIAVYSLGEMTDMLNPRKVESIFIE